MTPFALLYSGTICDMISCDFLAVLKRSRSETGGKKYEVEKIYAEDHHRGDRTISSSLFDEIGIQGIEIEDNVPLTESETEGNVHRHPAGLLPDDGTARVSFYLDDDDDAEAILKEVDEGLSELRQYVEIGEGTITASETEDKDWINNWKQYFKPFTVDHILIKPTWEEIPEEHKDKLLIQIARERPLGPESMRPPSSASDSWKNM